MCPNFSKICLNLHRFTSFVFVNLKGSVSHGAHKKVPRFNLSPRSCRHGSAQRSTCQRPRCRAAMPLGFCHLQLADGKMMDDEVRQLHDVTCLMHA